MQTLIESILFFVAVGYGVTYLRRWAAKNDTAYRQQLDAQKQTPVETTSRDEIESVTDQYRLQARRDLKARQR